MFKNYLKIAIRNLIRHKLYSFINIGGLSLGLAACLMIFLFVKSELSYDRWLPDNERVYRLEGIYHAPGKPDNPTSLSPGPIAPALSRSFPNYVEATARLIGTELIVNYDGTRFIEEATYTDPGFFDVFDLPIVTGNAAQLFEGFDKIVISARMAEKYFGDQPAVGEVLDIDNGEQSLQVVAVMANLPENSHLDIDFLLHFEEARYTNYPWVATWWLSSNTHSYLKFRDQASAQALEAELPTFVNENAVLSPTFTDERPPSEILSMNFMPVTDIHLHSKGKFQIKQTGDIIVVYSFTGIAILILVIAVINFTNLSTARASLRAREIALRKVVGATRRHIIYQFLGEALVTVFLSTLVAFVIVEAALPWFNNFVEKLLSFDVFADLQVQLGLLGLLIVVSLGAGAHPAFKMSSFRPAKVLHSKNAATSGSVKLRAILTTVQFTISIGLMITTAVIYSQLRYAQTMDVGFDKNHKMAISNMRYGPMRHLSTTIQSEIEALPGVNATSYSARRIPLRGYWDSTSRVVSDGRNDEVLVERVPGDAKLLELLGAKLLAGRFFSEDRRGDLPQAVEGEENLRRQSGIINMSAANHMGYAEPADALGSVIRVADSGNGFIDTTVVGVVADMHLRSLRDPLDNNVFTLEEAPLGVLNVDLVPGMLQETSGQIEAIWNKHAPEVPFVHRFIDETFDAYYEADARRGEVFAYFSGFAILVSCLGLYGLASFTAERRVKEIGVRKVMGASVTDIVRLLTFQFSKPVLLANLIAWPIAWFIASDWLSGFQYRIDLGVSYFLAAGAAALLIACLTVAGHAIKTAQANPVLALKHE